MNHSVYQFADFQHYEACDFTSSILLGLTSPVNVNLNVSGFMYYGCQYPTHCSLHNMKVFVNVTQASQVSTSMSQMTTQSSASNSGEILHVSIFTFFFALLFSY